jgi:hypothetical protein
MAVNHKLTSIIKGRVVRASEADASGVQITFKDSSTMKVKTAGSQAPTIPEGVGCGRPRSMVRRLLSGVKATPRLTSL